MNISKATSRSALALSAALMLFAVAPAWAGPNFLVLPDTTSPDGRYAFAWGLPAEFKVDWDKLRQTESDPVIEEFLFDRDVANYLVDLQTNRVHVELSAAQAWQLPNGTHGNHRNLEIRWAPESDLAIAGYSEKWGSLSVEVFRIAKDGAQAAVDIKDDLEKAFRAHLGRTEGKRYAQRAKRLEVSFSQYTADGGGKFSAVAFAEIPKATADEDQFAEQRLRFSLTPARAAGVAVKVIAIEDTSAPDAALAERLAAGDRQLNSAYQQVIAALDAAGVKKLRSEQRAWLKERDAVTDAEERAVFIEKRAQELRDRVRKPKR
jgi:hypothetical protein